MMIKSAASMLLPHWPTNATLAKSSTQRDFIKKFISKKFHIFAGNVYF